MCSVPLVIVVDDGSIDGTDAALVDLPVTLLRNETNCGKAASLVRGFAYALERGANAIVTIDGDAQHRPSDIPFLLSAYERHPGAVVIGSRLHEEQNIPADRYLANRFANFWIAWAAGHPIKDSQSGFRVYPAALLREIRLCHDRAAGFVFESEVLIEAGRRGYSLIPVPISAIYEPRGRRSHFRPIIDILRIVRMVAWKLISRGLYPQGLARSLRRKNECGSDGSELSATARNGKTHERGPTTAQ